MAIEILVMLGSVIAVIGLTRKLLKIGKREGFGTLLIKLMDALILYISMLISFAIFVREWVKVVFYSATHEMMIGYWILFIGLLLMCVTKIKASSNAAEGTRHG